MVSFPLISRKNIFDNARCDQSGHTCIRVKMCLREKFDEKIISSSLISCEKIYIYIYNE